MPCAVTTTSTEKYLYFVIIVIISLSLLHQKKKAFKIFKKKEKFLKPTFN
jgi:hypothetical protein